MKNYLTIAAAAVLLTAPAQARAEDMKMHMNMGGPGSGSAADKAFTASMQKMMQNMEMKPTGNPDKDFVMMMLPHHQGAVDMAKVELQYGKDPMLLKMAGDIVKAQEEEIATMKAWLAKNGK